MAIHRQRPSTSPQGERIGPTPTITKPDLDEVRDVKPKALRPYKVVVLD